MGEPNELLEAVVAAHGGYQHWQAVRQLVVRLRVGGNILLTRRQSSRARALSVTIDTRRVYATLRPFPAVGLVGVYEGDAVRLETEKGALVRERLQARASCQRRLVWDELNVLYFFGYAFWNYMMTPYLFLWPGFKVEELAPIKRRNQWWRRLQVTFPPSVPTHCPVQTFYFDEAGLLGRLDYTAEIFGQFARGAHWCEAHQRFSGVMVPTHRKVLPRLLWGGTLPGPSAMEGWIEDVSVLCH